MVVREAELIAEVTDTADDEVTVAKPLAVAATDCLMAASTLLFGKPEAILALR